MQSSKPSAALAGTLRTLQSFGVIPATGRVLANDTTAIVEGCKAKVVEEVAAFSASGNPEVLPELYLHLQALVGEVCRLLGGGRPEEFTFLRAYSRRLAEQRFPLEASLHAYRCCHRVLSAWIRDQALAVADRDAQVRRVVAATADFAIEFTDAISTVATAEYVLQTRLLAEAAGDRRTELLNTLLGGYDESDGRAAQLLRRAGYLEQRQTFCVAVARSVDAREMENPARAKRMQDAVTESLGGRSLRVLAGIRDGVATVVLSATRRTSGWTAPQSLLAERVYAPLLQVGTAALIGLSSDAPSTTHVRRAHKEALTALDFASVSNRVQPYASIPFRQMLVRHAQDNLQSSLPHWLAPLQAANQSSRGKLAQTLQAYADANMNALQTAKALAVHPNTIYARMQKISDLTGKNALAYHDLSELLLALEATNAM